MWRKKRKPLPALEQPPAEVLPPASPLTDAQFAALMKSIPLSSDDLRFAVAVSGGPDSMALLSLLHHWLKERNGILMVFTVDHELREASTQEAAMVANWCHALHIPHQTLRWDKALHPQHTPHEVAREARYALLIQACKQNKLDHLFLGQHADDQAETVLIRFIKGSGLDGLAGMATTRLFEGITLARPLLPVFKNQLEALCQTQNIPFIRDPSNQATRYLRGRLREAQTLLHEEGLTPQRLYDFSQEAAAARHEAELALNAWLETHAQCDVFGGINVKFEAWARLPLPAQARMLNRCLQAIGGEPYPPRQDPLHRLIAELLGADFSGRTLHGARILKEKNVLAFFREEEAVTPPIPLADYRQDSPWDHRFILSVHPSLQNQSLNLRKLGAHSRAALHAFAQTHPNQSHTRSIAELPAILRATLPALFDKENLVHIPEFSLLTNVPESQQPLVKAVFCPKNPLIQPPFHVPPPRLYARTSRERVV